LKKDNRSYSQILRSSVIFGGSQALTILIGLVRTKIIALLIGTAGIGIIGVLQSVVDVLRTGFSLGMDTAGVKEIAETESKGDKPRLDSTISRFNLWFRTTALLGLLTCIVLCFPISRWAFGDTGYAWHIAALSASVFFAVLTVGRSSVLQGLRKIPEMAKASVWGSLAGLVATIPLFFIWGIKGIVPALIISNLISFLSIEYYYRKQKISKVKISAKDAFSSGLSTLGLGIYIVTAGLVGTAAMFIVRAFITRNIDVDAAGLFQSAWVITNVYLGLVLRSMGTDFFPRLSALGSEKDKIKSLVNEQTYIVLVIASPLIVGLLLFSGFALQLLYSSEFLSAASLLQWQLLGSFLKVLSWPVAFIMLAGNRGRMFLLTEIVFYAAYLLSSYLLYPSYGLDAAGIGYLIAYVIYLPMVYLSGRKIAGFRWSNGVLIITMVNAVLISSAFCFVCFANDNIWLCLALFTLSLVYAFINLRKVFSMEDLKNWFRKE